MESGLKSIEERCLLMIVENGSAGRAQPFIGAVLFAARCMMQSIER
jgi:hypothetical protein